VLSKAGLVRRRGACASRRAWDRSAVRRRFLQRLCRLLAFALLAALTRTLTGSKQVLRR